MRTENEPMTTKPMLVTKVLPIAGEFVEFEGQDSYIRYSTDNWEWCIGESKESVYDCEELEKAYQTFKRGVAND